MTYLGYAHRLFGFRGGGAADRALYDYDSGWSALERATPVAGRVPTMAATAAGSSD
jgi:hypothetical protein